MRTLTLAFDPRTEIHHSGDMPLPEAKQLIDLILNQQAFEQGRLVERQKIRQGYKAKRARQ